MSSKYKSLLFNKIWKVLLLPKVITARNVSKNCNLLCKLSPEATPEVSTSHYIYFHPSFQDITKKSLIINDMTIVEDFITEEEEQLLTKEADAAVSRLKYSPNHWDEAITGYRETEKRNWSEENMKVLDRVKQMAFSGGTEPLKFVHVLDLKDDGVIKPHIDSVKFCGSTIAGISLLSDSVMRLQHDKDKEKIVDFILKRRSLYVMRDYARYEFTHEILGNENSTFGSSQVMKSRRISVICRNEPK